MTTESTYRVTVDLNACDGVFACLVRDDRFVEHADGLVEFDSDADGLVEFDSEDAIEPIERTAESVTATFADDRIDDARAAAAACPLDAITVEEAGDA